MLYNREMNPIFTNDSINANILTTGQAIRDYAALIRTEQNPSVLINAIHSILLSEIKFRVRDLSLKFRVRDFISDSRIE